MPASGQGAEDWIVISRLQHTQGNRGELFGEILTDFPERFDSLEEVTLGNLAGHYLDYRVEYTRWHKKGIVFKFAGIDSISEAEALVGNQVLLDPTGLPPLEEGTYYQFDLIGCRAVDESGAFLGRVVRVDDFGGNQLLAIQPESKPEEEFWVPFSKEHVCKVECTRKEVTLRISQELIGLNRKG